MGKDIISLDFDGVIHSYASGWKGADIIPDPPFPGAIQALRLYVSYFRVTIVSSRNNQEGGIPAMREWIRKWAALEFGGNVEWTDEIEFPLIKPPAKVILDDRAITFNGTWPTVADLKKFKPWYLLEKRKRL